MSSRRWNTKWGSFPNVGKIHAFFSKPWKSNEGGFPGVGKGSGDVLGQRKRLMSSLDAFTKDYMEERNQPDKPERGRSFWSEKY